MNGPVYALAVSGSDVYVGGDFTTAGGVGANRIAKWDGSSWSALGSGIDGSYAGYTSVDALAVSGSDVYAGGWFTIAGGVSAKGIAKWDGSSWSALGSGMDETYGFGTVSALAVSGSNVYAGGNFSIAGGVSANNIAKWDGSSWSALGSGVHDSFDDMHLEQVMALAVSGSDVYAGGNFTTAGGVSAKGIAKWDGSSWSALGSGMDDYVYALAVSGSDVYAGGDFATAGGIRADCIAKWNGSSWSAMGNGMNNSVSALAVTGNALVVGGNFTSAGGKGSSRLAVLQPRVDVSTATVSDAPGAMTVGDSPLGFNRPALITGAGTTVSYAGALPTPVTLDRADEIQVYGKRVNGAFTLSPGGMRFGGTGAVVRVEFSEVDVAAMGGSYTDFRAVKLTYPATYPRTKEAASATLLPGQSAPAPIRIDNGKQIYAITAPISEIASTYGAVSSRSWPDLSGSWSGVSFSTRSTRTGSVCMIKGRLAISNRGNDDAARSVARVYVSDAPSVAADNAPIKSLNVNKLKRGKSSNCLVNVKLPASVQLAGKYLIAVLDANDAVSESNEANNVVVWGPF